MEWWGNFYQKHEALRFVVALLRMKPSARFVLAEKNTAPRYHVFEKTGPRVVDKRVR